SRARERRAHLVERVRQKGRREQNQDRQTGASHGRRKAATTLGGEGARPDGEARRDSGHGYHARAVRIPAAASASSVVVLARDVVRQVNGAPEKDRRLGDQ